MSKLNEVTEACNPIVDEFNTALKNFESEEGADQIGDILDRLQTEYKKILEVKAPKGYEDCTEKFQEAADKLEGSENFAKDCKAYTAKLLKAHYRVIFNYNGYGPEWEPEAERRGLLNNKSTADAVPEFFRQENIDVFVKQGVYTKSEALARANIQLENYVKTILIEARTMLDMAKKQIYPAVSAYVGKLCGSLAAKKAVAADLPCRSETALVKTLSAANDAMMAAVNKLEGDIKDIPEGVKEASQRMAHVVVPDMEEIRRLADGMETLCAKEYWPFPTYTEWLFGIV